MSVNVYEQHMHMLNLELTGLGSIAQPNEDIYRLIRHKWLAAIEELWAICILGDE